MEWPGEILLRVDHLGGGHLWEAPLLVWPQDPNEISDPQLHLHGWHCLELQVKFLKKKRPMNKTGLGVGLLQEML